MIPRRTDIENPQVSQSIVGMALRQLDLWLVGRIDDRQVESAARELVEFAFRGFSR